MAFTWFGDKSAASVTGGGQITDGVNIELFKTCDGFSNVCLPSVPTIPDSTLKLQPTQKNHMHYKIKDERNRHCHINIRCDVARCRQPDFQKDGCAIFATKSMCDALTHDMKEKYKVIMPWEVVFDGVEVSKYDGTTIVKCSIWDRFIQAYQNNKTKLNLPHRAVLCSPENLMYGCEGTEPMSDLDIWFDKKARKNYIYSTGKLGSMIGEDELVQVAY